MNIYEASGLKDFNIEEILECGQCFRFERLGDMRYRILALGEDTVVWQDRDRLLIEGCTEEAFNNKWRHYFDLETDYGEIKKKISENDPVMCEAVEFAGGIRLLNQEPYECLLSFIISQNNNIPRIKRIIGAMCDKYGKGGCFPTLEEMSRATEEELCGLKMGFRSRYIYDAVRKLSGGEVRLKELFLAETAQARAELEKIKGVGPKVADCVLLFSLGHREVFPVDVWVRRVISELYFGGEEQSIKTIGAFAAEKWGALAGYAQQYLFYYARSGRLRT